MSPSTAAPFPREGRPFITCDFDGTITRTDVGYTLVERYGRPGWKAFEERWRRGEISSAECMRAEFAHVEIGRAELDRFIDSIEVDPAFAPFVAQALQTGRQVTILSDGLDYYILRILERLHLAHLPLLCNRAIFHEDGRLDLEAPYPAVRRDAAGNFKAHHVGVLRQEATHVTFIGDGHSDRGAAQVADRVHAKGELLRYCQEQDIPCHAFEDFGDLARLL